LDTGTSEVLDRRRRSSRRRLRAGSQREHKPAGQHPPRSPARLAWSRRS